MTRGYMSMRFSRLLTMSASGKPLDLDLDPFAFFSRVSVFAERGRRAESGLVNTWIATVTVGPLAGAREDRPFCLEDLGTCARQAGTKWNIARARLPTTFIPTKVVGASAGVP